VIGTFINDDGNDNEEEAASEENSVWKVIQITNDRGNNLGADMELRCSKGD
jgi:hypothetical protein